VHIFICIYTSCDVYIYKYIHVWYDTRELLHVYLCVCYDFSIDQTWSYGVATISRLLQIIGLFCKWALHKRWYSVKEPYHFKEPTTRSHPIYGYIKQVISHMNMIHTWTWPTHEYDSYMDTTHTCMWPPHEDDSYMSLTHTWIWPTHDTYHPYIYIHWNMRINWYNEYLTYQ